MAAAMAAAGNANDTLLDPQGVFSVDTTGFDPFPRKYVDNKFMLGLITEKLFCILNSWEIKSPPSHSLRPTINTCYPLSGLGRLEIAVTEHFAF